ncbi:hypothetical protein [Runella sp.]|uniref:hypothetical protein n=1 Tax=Runella sp. TaxID=1960881 RepID=UPI003D0E326E
MDTSKKYTAFAFLLLPIVIFYGFSVAYSTNIPWFDDIENIPYFLSGLLDSQSWHQRVEAFLRPNNEHRVLSARLIVYLTYLMTNEINFRALALAGNLTVLGIFSLIGRAYLKNNVQPLHLIPAAFFIFNLQFYSMTFMTIMSLQYQLIICEVFLSLYLLIKPTRLSFGGAILTAILGTFSMGNGLMVWPTGALLLLYLGQRPRLITWLIIGILAIVGYFSGYAFVQGNDEGFSYFFQHPLKVIIGFFAFAGGILDWFPRAPFEKRMVLPVVGGVFIVCFFLFYTFGVMSISARWRTLFSSKFTKFYLRIPYFRNLELCWGAFWVGCFVYLLITGALVVFFRTRFDYQLILWATYKIYPGTLMAITAILLLQILAPMRQKFGLIPVLSASLLSWSSSYWYFVPQVQHDQKQRLAFAFNQQRNGVGLGAEKNSAFAKFIVAALDSAEHKGFYKLPEPLIDPQEKDIEKMLRNSTLKLPTTSVKVDNQATTVVITNEIIEYTEGKSMGAFISLTSPTYFHLFSVPAKQVFHNPQKGFLIHCPKGVLYNETYQIGVWIVQNTGNQLFRTGQSVTIN